MRPHSLFLLVLRVLGLFFLRDFVTGIPAFASVISVLLGISDSDTLAPVIGGLLILGIYGYMAYLLLFRTAWIIEKLRLTEGFEEDSLSFSVHRSTVLSIAVIVLGAWTVVDVLPAFLRNLFLLFNENRPRFLEPAIKADKTLFIADVVRIVVGLLLLGNVQRIVALIEARRRRAAIQEVADEANDDRHPTPVASTHGEP